VLPQANALAMNLHLAEISTLVTPGAHAVITLDGAGWHKLGGRLVVPPNLSLLHLPPYSPELNPVENVCKHPARTAVIVQAASSSGGFS
jgi:transposase